MHRLQLSLYLPDLLFLLLDLTVTDLSDLAVITLTLRLISLKLQVLNIDLILLDLIDLLLLALPLSLLLGLLLLQVGDLLVELLQLRGIVLTLDRLTPDLQLFDTAGNLIQRLRYGIDLQTQTGGGLIHQIDRLIRQETIRDITGRQLYGRDNSIILDTYFMVILIFLLQTTKDGDRIQLTRLVYDNGLEPTLKRLILLKILLILIQRRGTDRT